MAGGELGEVEGADQVRAFPIDTPSACIRSTSPASRPDAMVYSERSAITRLPFMR